MKRKTMIIALLTMAICFSAVFATTAATLSAKEIVINKVNDWDWEWDFYKKYYDKSSGSVTYQIDKLEGSLVNELGKPNSQLSKEIRIKGLAGSKLQFGYELDIPNKAAFMDINANVLGGIYQGKVYMNEHQLIFDKNFIKNIYRLESSGRNVDEIINNLPEYAYVNFANNQNLNAVMPNLWTTIALNHKQQPLPEAGKELAVFILEAVPEEFFDVSMNKVTIELDQEGFEDVIYSLLIKTRDEKERFAGIIADIMADYSKSAYFTGNTVDPHTIKAEIIGSIEDAVENGNFPTRKQIHGIAQFIQVEKFIYEASVMPGGQKDFNAIFVLQPASGASGEIEINSTTKGKIDNLEGSYNIKFDIKAARENKVSAEIKSDFSHNNNQVNNEFEITGSVIDIAAGERMLDIVVRGTSNLKAGFDGKINLPDLTAQNSINVEALPEPWINKQEVPKTKEGILIFVNNKFIPTDVAPYIQDDGRTMVPVRFVAEALDSDVKWIEPNVIKITRGDNVISMLVNEYSYTVNNSLKKMDAVPVVKKGRTFIPVRFVAEALDSNVKWVKPNKIYIATN